MKLFILGERSPGKETICGWISAGELMDQYSKEWFPPYQRDRVNRRKKIEELKKVFRSGGQLPAVVLNLMGTSRKVTDGYNFEGDLHVIDGQQRVMALLESENRDYLLFVQAHVNMGYEEEVRTFQDLNTKGTKLPLGYLIRSIVGPGAEVARKFTKKGASALPISINDRKGGLPLAWLAALEHALYKKVVEKKLRTRLASGKEIVSFLADQSIDGKLVLVEFAMRNILREYSQLFGSYDSRALAYFRSVFLPVCSVIIHNFITKEGKIDYRGFRGKMQKAAQDFLGNAFVRESIASSSGGGAGSIMVYEEFVKYLNRGVREGNRLPSMSDLRDLAAKSKKVHEVSEDPSSETLAIDDSDDSDDSDDHEIDE